MVLAEELSFAYAGGPQLLAGVSFEVQPGSRTAIAGRNGVGKSTLLRLINGLLKPTTGRLTVAGVLTGTTSASSLARQVATVFQSPEQQIFASCVIDEVSFGPRQLGLSRSQVDEAVDLALARTGLKSFSAVHPLDLPHASQKFVALASALAMRPRLLLLDEPQQGLDAAAVSHLEGVLKEEQSAGTTVLFICHDMDFIGRNASEVIVLTRGKILAQEEPLSIFGNEALISAAGLRAPDLMRLSQELRLPPVLAGEKLIEHWRERRYRRV